MSERIAGTSIAKTQGATSLKLLLPSETISDKYTATIAKPTTAASAAQRRFQLRHQVITIQEYAFAKNPTPVMDTWDWESIGVSPAGKAANPQWPQASSGWEGSTHINDLGRKRSYLIPPENGTYGLVRAGQRSTCELRSRLVCWLTGCWIATTYVGQSDVPVEIATDQPGAIIGEEVQPIDEGSWDLSRGGICNVLGRGR